MGCDKNETVCLGLFKASISENALAKAIELFFSQISTAMHELCCAVAHLVGRGPYSSLLVDTWYQRIDLYRTSKSPATCC